MKSEKIIKMMSCILLVMTLFSYVVTTFSHNPIVKISFNKGFSFIFPTFVFISFWYIQLMRKSKDLSLPKYYLYVCLNTILPYLICIIPYMVYESNTNFLDAIISGNNMPQFLYFKTMIELCIIYPIVELGMKRMANFFSITLLAITIIFNLFNLSAYLFTKVFEYIIFVAIGIYFAEYEKKANSFLRKNKYKIRYSVMEAIILMCFTLYFEEYGFINPAITTFYSLAVMFEICYICLKLKALYAEFRFLGRGAILDFFTHNPIIIFSAVVLLHPLIFRIIYDLFVKLELSKNVINCIIFFISILIFAISKKVMDNYYIKHKKEVYLQKQRW